MAPIVSGENTEGWVLGLTLEQEIPVSQGSLVFSSQKSTKVIRKSYFELFRLVCFSGFEDAGGKQCLLGG